jgi:hypothetical protein
MLTLLTQMKNVFAEQIRSSERISRPNAKETHRYYSQILCIDSIVIVDKDIAVD